MASVKGQVPVKVTNVSLGGFSERAPWSGTLQFDPSILTVPDERGKASISSICIHINMPHGGYC